MGVTNRSKITYKASVASSTVASSSESLHLPSESGSYQPQEPEHGDLSFRRALSLLTRDNVTRITPLGRRRANRMKCLYDLENLGRIDEEEETDTIATYAANRHSPFSQIINDDRLSKVWEHFCSRSDTEQGDILVESRGCNIRNRNKSIVLKYKEHLKRDRDGSKSRQAIEAYKSLTYLTRRRLRKVKNLQPLSVMEQMILDHFYTGKRNILENMKLGKQSQFICCAACQYYNLEMKTQRSDQGGLTCTIAGPDSCYTHCAVTLSSFLHMRRGISSSNIMLQ